MKLITPKLKVAFKKQGDTSEKSAKDIKVIAKFFCPWGSATWFATDYYEDENICFGYANVMGDDCAELGYFSVDELEKQEGPMGLRIERDRYWEEHTLEEVMACKGHL